MGNGDSCSRAVGFGPLVVGTVLVTTLVVTGWLVTGLPVTGLPVTGLPVTGLPVTGLPVTGLPVTGLPVTGLPVTGLLVRALLATTLRRGTLFGTGLAGSEPPPRDVPPPGAARGVPAVPAFAERPPLLTETSRSSTVRAAVTYSPARRSSSPLLLLAEWRTWRPGRRRAGLACWPRLDEGGRLSAPIARP